MFDIAAESWAGTIHWSGKGHLYFPPLVFCQGLTSDNDLALTFSVKGQIINIFDFEALWSSMDIQWKALWTADNIQTNRHAPIAFSLWTLKCECYVVDYFYDYFQSLINAKTTLSSRVIQKQMAVQIWPWAAVCQPPCKSAASTITDLKPGSQTPTWGLNDFRHYFFLAPVPWWTTQFRAVSFTFQFSVSLHVHPRVWMQKGFLCE